MQQVRGRTSGNVHSKARRATANSSAEPFTGLPADPMPSSAGTATSSSSAATQNSSSAAIHGGAAVEAASAADAARAGTALPLTLGCMLPPVKCAYALDADAAACARAVSAPLSERCDACLQVRTFFAASPLFGPDTSGKQRVMNLTSSILSCASCSRVPSAAFTAGTVAGNTTAMRACKKLAHLACASACSAVAPAEQTMMVKRRCIHAADVCGSLCILIGTLQL